MKKSIQTNNTQVKASSKNKLTILQCIEIIAITTKESELNPQTLKPCFKYIKHMATTLNLTDTQCIFLSVFISMYDDSSISNRDIKQHFDISAIQILEFQDVIDDLLKLGYIKKNTVRRGYANDDTYSVPKSTITCLQNNLPLEKKQLTNLSNDQLFEALDNIFDLLYDEEISIENAYTEFDELIQENTHLAFVSKIKKLADTSDNTNHSLLIFLYMCSEIVENEKNEVNISDFESLFERKNNFRKARNLLNAHSHPLMNDELIEVRKTNSLFARDTFCLTKKACKEYLSEFDIQISLEDNNLSKNTLKHTDIVAKQMFYNPKEQTQIAQLSSLLTDNQFRSVQQRLQENGMRQGFAALFYGSPGTGKTETVLQVARLTGRNVIQINVSQIKSMWVGESEKNIKAIFDDYRSQKEKSELAPILLFNEADAILGNRMQNTQRAVDKMENSIQNIILEEMEKLDGIMIATTNLTENLDSAFERRFLYKIEFDKPSHEAKSSIWKSMIPSLSDDDANVLASAFNFSGGQIENIARKQTVDTIINGTTPTLEQLVTHCNQENITKKHKTMGFA